MGILSSNERRKRNMVTKILAPLDCTELAEAGMHWAEQAARRSGAAIHLLTVVEPSEGNVEERLKSAESYLQSQRDQLKGKGLTAKVEIAVGEPAQTIIDRSESVDLTVVSSGTVRWLISAVLDRVLAKMTRPIVVVRAGTPAPIPAPDRILMALDQTAYSGEIVPIVQQVAKALSASVTLCHAVAPQVDGLGNPTGGGSAALADAEHFIEEVAQRLRDEGVETDTVVAIGDPPAQIVQTAQRQGAGLIALTTRGRDRMGSRYFGSTANAILHSTRLPCLLTRHEPAPAGAGISRSSSATA
jgi:nucleotide-binding universal stress UspA family protein